MTRSRLIKILVALVLIGGGALAYVNAGIQKKQEATALNTATVTRGDIEAVVTAQGKLEPKNYVDVGAEVSGKIEKLYVDFGSAVKSGAILAEIDPATFESAVKADMARVKQLEAQIKQQDANILQAEQKLARNKTLFDSRAVSQEVYQDAQTALKIARAQSLSLEAQLEEAQSILEGDQADLERTKIYAPMDGTVVSLSVKEGQTINANQTAPVIAQIAELGVMTVRAQVAEADINKITPEMPVYFTTLGSQGRKWPGKIRQILPSPQTVNDVVLYNVLVDVENPDGQLMTGMTTQLFFIMGSAKNVPTLPSSVLIKRKPAEDTPDAKAYEIKALEAGRQIDKTVLIGLSDRTSAQIISGLNEGDKIVLPTPPTAAGTAAGARAGGMGRTPRL